MTDSTVGTSASTILTHQLIEGRSVERDVARDGLEQ
jgi:hypothetical protein